MHKDAMLLWMLILVLGNFCVVYGWHNIDTAWNMKTVAAETGIEYFESNLVVQGIRINQVYMLGYVEIVIGLYLALISSFKLGQISRVKGFYV
jgi:hypothetical protein